jgi:transcriptional regulator with XRE-family HTH domain
MYGEILKKLRIEKELTQQQLAEILGFKSASAIGMVERQERELSVETIIRISDYFNVPSDYLMGLVPFKNETEAYHSISIASVKYLRDHPLVFPYGLHIYIVHAEAYVNKFDDEIKAYCHNLLSKYEEKLSLTALEFFELSNILFLNVKWSPDYNGIVHFQGFNDEFFSIKLDLNKIDKVTLDLSKSTLLSFKKDNNNFVKYTSILGLKSEEPGRYEAAAQESGNFENPTHNNADTIDRRLKDVEFLENFEDAEQALKFILSQPLLAAYGGYDLDSMTDEEIIEIANDMLFAMRLSLQKLKKKNK